MTASPSGSATSPPSQAWEVHRATITTLYIDQKMSLLRLMDFMRSEHNFHATSKMYRKRFAAWNLRKNITTKRAVDALRQSPDGVDSLGSHTADAQRRQQFFHRLPRERREKLLEAVLQPANANVALVSGGSTASPIWLTLPSELRVPEYYVHLLDAYVRGSSDAKQWPRDEKMGFMNEDTVPAWCSSVMSAHWVLAEGKEAEARRFLESFVRQCSQQLTRQDPLIFPFVYTSILYFAKSRPDLGQWLLAAICSVSETLPWANSSHPLRLLLDFMLRIGQENIVAHASKILLLYIDIIYKTLGAAYSIVQDMLSDAMMRCIAHNLMSAEEVANVGRRMVLAAELQNRDRCKFHLNLKMRLADAYLRTNRPGEAWNTAMEILAERNDHIRGERMMPSLHMLLSRIELAEGKVEHATESALRALVSSIDLFGKESDWTLNSLIFYRRMLVKAGRFDDAQRVAQDRDWAIEELCSKTEKLVGADGTCSA